MSAAGYNHSMQRQPGVEIIARAAADLRDIHGWTQDELAARAGISQGMISAIEHARVPGLTMARAEQVLGALGATLVISVDAPFLGDRDRQRDPAHARCSAYVTARLRRAGWEVAAEVEVGGDRSRGWIDVLAFHPSTRQLLVIEIKTEIRDLGAIERTLGWYERESQWSARRLGWQASTPTGCLILLATEANDLRVRANLRSFAGGFPLRSRDLSSIVLGEPSEPSAGRAVAMIDPLSRRASWLRPLMLDGRRSTAPYPDYAGFMRAAASRRARP